MTIIEPWFPPQPEIIDAGAAQAGDLDVLRQQLAETQRRLAEELTRNKGLYADRAADRAAMGQRHEDLHGANVQLLRDRQALEETNLRLELRVAELEKQVEAKRLSSPTLRSGVTFGDLHVYDTLNRIADAVERLGRGTERLAKAKEAAEAVGPE